MRLGENVPAARVAVPGDRINAGIVSDCLWASMMVYIVIVRPNLGHEIGLSQSWRDAVLDQESIFVVVDVHAWVCSGGVEQFVLDRHGNDWDTSFLICLDRK